MAKGKHAPAPGAVRKDKVIHPNSRKAVKLKSHAQKRAKIQAKVGAGGQRLQALGEKLSWFKENLQFCLGDGQERPTAATVKALAEAYLSRFEEELEQIGVKAGIGSKRKHQHASRLDVIEHAIKADREEFDTCGLEMPDMLDKDGFDYFSSWEGELRYVQNIKLKRFTRSWLEEQIKCEGDTENTACTKKEAVVKGDDSLEPDQKMDMS